MTKTSKGFVKDPEAAARAREERRQAAEDRLTAFLEAPDVQGWVKVRRLVHQFSLRNQLHVWLQLVDREIDPADASPVKAAWRWKKDGYHPAKGSHALWVLGPVKKKKGPDGMWQCGVCRAMATGARCPQGHERRTFFVPKPVFAACDVVSFSTGERPPPPPAPVMVEGDELEPCLDRLYHWALQSDDCPVAEIEWLSSDADHHLRDGASGYYDPKGCRVVISRDMSANAQVKTTIHELAHAYGGIDYAAYSRAHAELIVEAAAYLACDALGLEQNEYSAAYIASWGGREGEDPKGVLLRHMTVIDRLATTLEQAASRDPKPTQEDPDDEA